MKKLFAHVGIIEIVCAVNLAALAFMTFATAYTPSFSEERAVVASFLWLFTVIPVLPVAIYGIVDANKHAKGKHPKLTQLVVSWVTVVANGVAILSVFSPFW